VKVLYVALKYDYGTPSHGYSFEHYNFYESFLQLGCQVLYFDFGTLITTLGRDAMNRRLTQVVRAERPDLLFSVLVREELDPDVVATISRDTSTVTLNWFCDDHWRFEDFSRRWAPRFNWVVTTARSAGPKYRALGYDHVIKSQWGCNPERYRLLDHHRKRFDVTFVGLPHGNRRSLIERIRAAGIDVQAWGKGWPAGRIDQDTMIQVFNESRINLNLSNSSTSTQPGIRLLDLAIRELHRTPLGGRGRSPLEHWLASLRERLGASDSSRLSDQIKARNFEVPATGSFLLTGFADNLEEYYTPACEIGVFGREADVVDRIRHYLASADEREVVAAAGHARTLREHTYAHRFEAIFKRIGMPIPPAAEVLAGRIARGVAEDVS
jgi:spore maturation protein CgeB